jgi:hypothetical protein
MNENSNIKKDDASIHKQCLAQKNEKIFFLEQNKKTSQCIQK